MATNKKPDLIELKPVSAQGRQNGDYVPPVIAEPVGGPVPSYKPLHTPRRRRRGTHV